MTVAHVDEVIARPELLAAYAAQFSEQADATLVLYAPDSDAERVAVELTPALAAAGLDRAGAADAMLLSVPSADGDSVLAARANAVLSRRTPRPALASVVHTGPEATPLLGALATGAVTNPARPDGLGGALLRAVLMAAGAPDAEDNVDRMRFPDGQGTPARERIAGLLVEQLQAAVALEQLWDRLDAGSRQILVSLMAYKVLGWRKVRMPVGPFAQLRHSADQIRDLMLREERTGAIAFLDWQLDLYDLGALGLPIRLHSHPWLIINEFMLEQYRAPEPTEVAVRPGDVVIDGGGCWGETSLHFAHLAGPEGRVETFEFDPINLETLGRNLALNPELAKRVHVIPQPLWHAAGERLTYDSNGPGTRVGVGGAGPGVETTSIDALVASGVIERVDFVKLDVEGAELSALRGAADALRRFRPRLAVAAYHKADDLPVLTGFLDGLGVGYRFAIGHYTMALEETVLFAWCEDEA